MKEEFLQFIWLHRLFEDSILKTTDNQDIEIINVGFKNNNAGPDFYDAKIKIGEQLWAGTVELHINSSDWQRHKHTADKAYNNVILHVVYKDDHVIYNSAGLKIPTLELKFSEKLYNNYVELIMNKGPIPCSDFISSDDDFFIKNWQNRLLIQRLERKSKEVFKLNNFYKESWEETFYHFLAKNIGFKVNDLPFEMLAKSLPYKYISKQKDNLLQIEALLFGQAGFLTDDIDDEYFHLLKREYNYLLKKYFLKPIDKHLWKFLRLRPVNFPTIRIAQFAQILHRNINMFSKVIETKEVKNLKEFFKVSVSDYWNTHYIFGKESRRAEKKLGDSSINGILINSVSLFLFSYGLKNNLDEYKERALELLENIPAEKNNIITKWKTINLKLNNSFETQAMTELYNEYCTKGKCLDCNIGGRIIIRENY